MTICILTFALALACHDLGIGGMWSSDFAFIFLHAGFSWILLLLTLISNWASSQFNALKSKNTWRSYLSSILKLSSMNQKLEIWQWLISTWIFISSRTITVHVQILSVFISSVPLLEDKQRFKSGGLICMIFVCFTLHI